MGANKVKKAKKINNLNNLKKVNEVNKVNKALHPIKDWRKRKPIFLIFDILLSVVTIILVAVAYFSEQTSFLSIAFLFFGLTFFVKGLEYAQQGQKRYYKVNLFIALFLIYIGILSLWLY